jgi:hypothetical protein
LSSPNSRTTRRRASGYIVKEVDDVGPILTVLLAVAHQARGDRVVVGLVTDQDVAEVRTR